MGWGVWYFKKMEAKIVTHPHIAPDNLLKMICCNCKDGERQCQTMRCSCMKADMYCVAACGVHYCRFVCSHEFAEYFRQIRIFHSQSSSMNSANERIRMRKFSGSHTNWFIPTFHTLTKIFACENLVWIVNLLSIRDITFRLKTTSARVPLAWAINIIVLTSSQK